MARIDAIEIPKLLFDEGAAPSTPASTNVALYAKADGLLYSKDDAGVETLLSSGAALSNPMTTTGDLIYSSSGTGTPARRGIGSTGDVLAVVAGVPTWGGAWTAWTPALTATSVNPTMGTGSSVAGRYCQHGKLVEGWGRITFGTASAAAGTGQYLINYPVTPTSANQHVMGTAVLLDNSASTFNLGIVYTNADTISMRIAITGTALVVANNAPWTWANNDALYFEFKYEVS